MVWSNVTDRFRHFKKKGNMTRQQRQRAAETERLSETANLWKEMVKQLSQS